MYRNDFKTRNQKLGTRDQLTGTIDQGPETGNQKPGTRNQGPINRNHRPRTRDLEPKTRTRNHEPGNQGRGISVDVEYSSALTKWQELTIVIGHGRFVGLITSNYNRTTRSLDLSAPI